MPTGFVINLETYAPPSSQNSSQLRLRTRGEEQKYVRLLTRPPLPYPPPNPPVGINQESRCNEIQKCSRIRAGHGERPRPFDSAVTKSLIWEQPPLQKGDASVSLLICNSPPYHPPCNGCLYITGGATWRRCLELALQRRPDWLISRVGNFSWAAAAPQLGDD